MQTGIRDWQATVTLKELLICHGAVQLLSHFGLHANDLEKIGEYEIFPESASDIVTIYWCAQQDRRAVVMIPKLQQLILFLVRGPGANIPMDAVRFTKPNV